MDGGGSDRAGLVVDAPGQAADDAAPILHRRWTVKHTVASAIAVVLVTGGGVAFGVHRHNQQVRAEQASEVASATLARDEAVSALADSVSDYLETLAAAKDAVEAVTPDEPGEGVGVRYEVVDAALVTALVALVDASDDVIADATGEGSTGEFSTVGAHDEQIAAIESATATVAGLNGRVAQAAADLRAATDEVTASHDEWLIERARAAFDVAAAELNARIGASQGVMDGSAGQVADDAVRAALADSIAAASAAVEADPGETVDDLDALTAAIGTVATELDAKTQAVTGAQAAWRKAQDEAAAAAAQSSSKSARSPGGTRSSQSGGSSTAAPIQDASGSGVWWNGTLYPTGEAAMEAANRYECESRGYTFTAPNHCDQTPRTSTPAEAIAGITAARAAEGLQTVSSCNEIPGSIEAGKGVVTAITWDSWLTSTDHRAIVMAPKPAILSAWNGVSGTGTDVIYMRVNLCIVPS